MKWISIKDGVPSKEGEYLVYVEEFNSETFTGFSHYFTITEFNKKIIKTEKKENKIIHILSDEMDFSVNEYDKDIKVLYWCEIKSPF